MTLTQAKALTLSQPLFLVERLYAASSTYLHDPGWCIKDYEQMKPGEFRLILKHSRPPCHEMMTVVSL
jgi:hypothetical protein